MNDAEGLFPVAVVRRRLRGHREDQLTTVSELVLSHGRAGQRRGHDCDHEDMQVASHSIVPPEICERTRADRARFLHLSMATSLVKPGYRLPGDPARSPGARAPPRGSG